MKVGNAAAALLLAVALTGCTLSVNGKETNISDKPSLGLSLEKRTVEKIELGSQSFVNLSLADGNVTLTPWDKDYVELTTVSKLTAPADKATLEKLMEQYKLEDKSTSFDIELKLKQPEKPRLLSRFTEDIELKLPERLADIDVKAENGLIDVSGFQKATLINITLSSGKISFKNCKVYKADIKVDKGELYASAIEGKTSFKAGYADVQLEDIKGDLQLRSTSGKSIIERADGKLDCDISAGSIEIRNTFFKADSTVFATNGDIYAQPAGLDKLGIYSFRAVSGSISLDMPAEENFILNSKTGNGTITSDFSLSAPKIPMDPATNFNPLSKYGSGMELFGWVGSGGPSVIVYTYKGDIAVSKHKGNDE